MLADQIHLAADVARRSITRASGPGLDYCDFWECSMIGLEPEPAEVFITEGAERLSGNV